MYLLKVTHLDYYWIIAIIPRIQQGIITAFGDFYITKFYELNFEKTSRKWFILLHITNVYMLYCGSRTLINTLEMNLTCFALFNYSKAIKFYNYFGGSNQKKSDLTEDTSLIEVSDKSLLNEIAYVAIISASFVIRPTTAVFWIPLVLYHMKLLYKQRFLIRTLMCKLVPCALITLMVAGSIDSMMYGKVVFIPWNFFRINVLLGIGSQYGTEPWYYYFTHAVLPLLNISIVFVFTGIAKIMSDQKCNPIYLFSIVWTLFFLSLVQHKEQRFLLPLFPILLCYAAHFLHTINIRMHYKNMLAVSVVALNLLPLLYLVFANKVGATNVVSLLAKEFETDKNNQCYKTDVLFLLPCHSTPLYSHFHLDYPLDFLQCPPVIDSNWDSYSDDKDESDFFFAYPEKWILKKFPTKTPKILKPIPSHIVIFDVQANLEVFKNFFKQNNYVRCIDIFNTLYSENIRHGSRIYVYCHLKRNE